MKTLSKRATIYLDPMLHRALRMKAAETSRSLSELVNEAVKYAMAEDLADLTAFEERGKEPVVAFEKVLRDLKRNGRI